MALRSRSMKSNTNTIWNEDLMFVVAESFDDSLLVEVLGILNVVGISPMKKKNRTYAYCVAKYGPKWLDSLRNQVAAITTLRFKRAEAPLSKEVVEYMLDAGENVWSMRRGRAQFHRIAVLLNVLVFVAKHFDEKKITTVLSYFMFLYVVFCPWIILPSTILFLLLVGIWCYRTWPRYPSHTDIKLSHVDTTTVEELEEEFDNPFPSRFSGDNLRTRLTLPHSSLW
ncbi:hypothetical protein JHK87_021356 [Glycine soja]|nr:hypothetical protein JHK87_021356 [Glycine soja]